MRDISSRGAAVILAVLALMTVAFGGFVGSSSTDAAWTDDKTTTGSFRAEELTISAVVDLTCDIDNGTKPKTLFLSWKPPSDLNGLEVVYDVSWQDDKYPRFKGSTTVTDPEFGPYFPGYYFDEPKFPAQHANLTFTIQARVSGTDLRGEPSTFQAHGPVGSDVVIFCGPA